MAPVYANEKMVAHLISVLQVSVLLLRHWVDVAFTLLYTKSYELVKKYSSATTRLLLTEMMRP